MKFTDEKSRFICGCGEEYILLHNGEVINQKELNCRQEENAKEIEKIKSVFEEMSCDLCGKITQVEIKGASLILPNGWNMLSSKHGDGELHCSSCSSLETNYDEYDSRG